MARRSTRSLPKFLSNCLREVSVSERAADLPHICNQPEINLVSKHCQSLLNGVYLVFAPNAPKSFPRALPFAISTLHFHLSKRVKQFLSHILAPLTNTVESRIIRRAVRRCLKLHSQLHEVFRSRFNVHCFIVRPSGGFMDFSRLGDNLDAVIDKVENIHHQAYGREWVKHHRVYVVSCEHQKVPRDLKSRLSPFLTTVSSS